MVFQIVDVDPKLVQEIQDKDVAKLLPRTSRNTSNFLVEIGRPFFDGTGEIRVFEEIVQRIEDHSERLRREGADKIFSFS